MDRIASSGGEARNFLRNPVSGRVVRSTNAIANRQTAYDGYQAVVSEQITGGGEAWEISYRSSPAGRRLAQEASDGQAMAVHYDGAGRLNHITGADREQSMGYDAFGRVSWVKVVQGAIGLETTIRFDDFDREASRTLSLGGVVLETVHREYEARGLLREPPHAGCYRRDRQPGAFHLRRLCPPDGL